MQRGEGITGILLAAGSGSRFGGAKLLAPLPAASHGVPAGTPIGIAACRHLLAVVPDVVAVVRAGDRALLDLLSGAGARTIECGRAHEGMGITLAAGAVASAGARGWIVALADMPWIAPATIAAVAARLHDGASIVAPIHQGRRGHPVGFSARHYAALSALTGDEGAKSIVAAHADALEAFEVDDPGVLRDVDAPLISTTAPVVPSRPATGPAGARRAQASPRAYATRRGADRRPAVA